MSIDNKIIQLITKLIRETARGNVEWTIGYPPKSLTNTSEAEIYSYFQATYKHRKAAVYEQRTRYYTDEHEFYWTYSTCFALFDEEERLLLDFCKESPALTDLISTVREQVADLDGLLNDLLE